MPLWSVFSRFQNANTKAKYKYKDKCIGKWFLCPKCGIYLLNAASKRERQNANAKANAYENGFYALNAAFISWMLLRGVITRFQKASARQMERQRHRQIQIQRQMQIQSQMHRKMLLWSKCGIYLLNADLKCDLSISEGKYKGLMQKQRQMDRKIVFMR